MSGISDYFLKRGRSFIYALRGIGFVIRNEANFKIHIIATVLVVFMGFICDLSQIEWLVIILTISMVLTAEIFNSAIEQFLDHIQPGQNKKVGRIKDISAGAVLISAIGAVLAGILIFIPKLIALI